MIILTAVLILAPGYQAQSGDTYTVNTTADDLDANEGDGICETEAGECSLRAAVQEAEVDADQDTIAFNIGGGGVQTITITREVGSFDPDVVSVQQIDNPIIIDGTTQPGYAGTPLIVLDGVNVDAISRDRGLDLRGGDSIVRGLAIVNFPGEGILAAEGSNYTIEGNYIGVEADGITPAGNGRDGIVLSGSDSIIGGTTPDTRNVVSGNGSNGVDVNSNNNTLIGNYIGTDASGLSAIPNTFVGISLFGNNHQVTNNVISGNGTHGIEIEETDSATVQGNIIGLSADGTAPLPNGANGIETFTSNVLTNALIGGTQPSERNVISANNEAGIRVFNGSVTIKGNYIGTDITGTVDLGNQDYGVFLDGLDTIDTVLVGGSEPGAANLISGNGLDGVFVETVDGFITVQGNNIGTNVNVTGSIPNGRHGVYADFDPDSLLIEDNVIAGNGGHGIQGLGENMVIHGNFIGVNRANQEIGNSGHGVFAYNDNLTIGGINSGEANVIRGNGQSGVFVRRVANNVSIRGNTIYANGGIGIDLAEGAAGASDIAGVTPNDSGDVDTEGGNNLQNFPVISTATVNGSDIILTGGLNSVQIKSFTLDFYASEFCDSSGYGEGQVYLGSSDLLQTDGSGNVAFNVTLPYPGGAFVSATAFDQTGNTSEFAACVAVTGGSSPTASPTASPTTGPTTTPPPFITATPTNTSTISWIAPIGQIDTIGNPLYQWLEVPGATGYEIYVGPSDDYKPANFFGTVPASVCDGGVCSVDLTTQTSLVPGAVGWLVVPYSYAVFVNPDPGNVLTWEGPFVFTARAPRPAVPTITQPTGLNTSAPVLNWTLEGDAAFAAFFQLYLAPTSNLANTVLPLPTWVTREQVCGTWDGTTCSYTLPGALQPGTEYALYMQSWGMGGFSTGGLGGAADGWVEYKFIRP